MKGGDLYAKAIDDERDGLEFNLYPIGENELGRKCSMPDLKFGCCCLIFDDVIC